MRIFRPHLPIHWTWINLSGPDARDFLHRVTTVQVKSLVPGQGTPGCLLSAQGKVRSYFKLWNSGPDEFGFEFDAGKDFKWKSELITAIEQYTFAERQTLTDPKDEMAAVWLFAEPGESLYLVSQNQTEVLDPGIRLCHQGTEDFGTPWTTVWGKSSQLNSWILSAYPQAKEVAFEQVEEWRISQNRPRMDSEINENSIPLELGLVSALAQNKGCYPGQEVIERILALGSPAKRLAKIEGAGTPPLPGQKIYNLAQPATEVGEVTSSISRGRDFLALAILKKIHAKDGLEVQLGMETGVQTKGKVTQVAPYA